MSFYQMKEYPPWLRWTTKVVGDVTKVMELNCKLYTKLRELDEEGSIWILIELVLDAKECQLHKCTTR